MSALRRSLDRLVGGALALLMAAAVLNVVWQVVSRFLLAAPSAWTDELARSLLIWIGLLGAAYGVGQRLHVAVDLLPRRRVAAAGRWLALLPALLTMAFAGGVMVFGGLGLVRLSLALGQRSAALGVPMGWIYAVLPLAGGVIALYALLALLEPEPEAEPPGGGEGAAPEPR